MTSNLGERWEHGTNQAFNVGNNDQRYRGCFFQLHYPKIAFCDLTNGSIMKVWKKSSFHEWETMIDGAGLLLSVLLLLAPKRGRRVVGAKQLQKWEEQLPHKPLVVILCFQFISLFVCLTAGILICPLPTRSHVTPWRFSGIENGIPFSDPSFGLMMSERKTSSFLLWKTMIDGA